MNVFHLLFLIVYLINAYKTLFKFLLNKTLCSNIFNILRDLVISLINIDTKYRHKVVLVYSMASFYCLKNDFELAFRLEILECLNYLFLHERYIAVSLNITISGKVSGGFVLNVDQGKIIMLIVISFTRLCNNTIF